jgi:glycosyltransferase involved in cell wall biosynthesis
MKTALFYCNDSIDNILSMEYYRQDIKALESLGYRVKICTRYRDLFCRFDLMFVWWWTYALFPVVIAKLFNRPSLITGTFNFRFEKNFKGVDFFNRPWYQRLLIFLAVKITDVNLFVSKKEFNEVNSHFNLIGSYYFPHAVGSEYFSVDKNSSRSGLLNIAWSGLDNLKRKGVWDILEAMRLLKDRRVSLSLTLAGKHGDGHHFLQQRIIELDLEDCVLLIGEVTPSEKLSLFECAKLYLQPSYFEGFGLATAEAMAAGCCVITCDVGEVRNVVADCAYYVKPGRPSELADAIQLLLEDSCAIDNFNSKADRRMRELFSIDRKISTLRDVLMALN